jgi:hypothetical protein
MGARVPTLLWFGRDDARLGVLRPVGAVVHREEVGGEDVIEFACREVPTKYDRIVWRDPEDARWREHVVIRTDEAAGGVCEVYAESSLCDLLAGYIEEERLSSASVVEAFQTVLSGTRWRFTAEPGFGTGGCVLYHANRLAALRRVCEVWGCEVESEITVMFGGVTLRTLHARGRVGAWRGARLTYAKNMTGCVRTVCEDEVFTALFGYGAGLPVLDETGVPTGGYRRKLTFGEVNGGANWVGDEAARAVWGIPDGEGGRSHRFGEVTFPDVDDPALLKAKTVAALSEACAPAACYEADAAALSGGVPIGLGDDVLVVDSSRDPAWRFRSRVMGRVRSFGDEVATRLSIGRARRTAYAEQSAVAAAVEEARDAAGAAGDAAAAAGASAAEVRAATGAAAGADVPAIATQAYVSEAIAALDDLSEVEF